MKIGDKVRDMISGLTGEVTGEATYANGSHQFLVQPSKLDRDGRYQSAVWVDAYRLVADTSDPVYFGGQTLEGRAS